MDDFLKLLGVGLYSAPQAAKLTGVSTQRIRRWLAGYHFRNASGDRTYSPPVVRQDFEGSRGRLLTFRDLLEVRFVSAFRDKGVSWRAIRLCAARAADLFESTHPFSARRFLTDGRSIFADLVKTGIEEAALLDLAENQFAIRQVLIGRLYEGLEYAKSGDRIERWWPLGERHRVVLDPARSFGQPIDAKAGVRTNVLAAAFAQEHSYTRVAQWFDTEARAVKDAVTYEQRLAA
jgi:DNA-binding transcriptional MerR regulator/uncharacterized protein (DUF433 family)